MSGANLSGANLSGADFSGAKLMGAKGLTVEQLLTVKTLYDVEGIEPKIEEKLRHKNPELFKKPKD